MFGFLSRQDVGRNIIFLDNISIFDIDLEMVLGDGIEHGLHIEIRIESDGISIRINVGEGPAGHLEEEVLIDELNDGVVVLDFGEDLVDALVVEEQSHLKNFYFITYLFRKNNFPTKMINSDATTPSKLHLPKCHQ